MSEVNKYNVSDVIISAIEKKPLDFSAAFTDIVLERINAAVEDKKIQIAQQMYGYTVPAEEEELESE